MQLLALPDDLVDLLDGRGAPDRGRARLDVCDQLPEVTLRARRLGEEPVQVAERPVERRRLGCRLGRSASSAPVAVRTDAGCTGTVAVV